MSRTPYLSAEDSALLREVLRDYGGDSCLEIGAGNGGTLEEFGLKFGLVVGTDLVKPSMRDWSARGASYVLTDAAASIRDSCVDLVAINPPYLEGEDGGDLAVDGGVRLQVPRKFLREALRVLKPNGKILMLLNQAAQLSEFEKDCWKLGYQMRPVKSHHLFFETLTVYEISKNENVGRAQGRSRISERYSPKN